MLAGRIPAGLFPLRRAANKSFWSRLFYRLVASDLLLPDVVARPLEFVSFRFV